MFWNNKRGIQVTNQRLGRLEKMTLKYALDLNKNSITLDLGGGNGYISWILTLFHHQVFYYDIKPNWRIKWLKKIFNFKKLKILKKDLKKINYSDLPKNIDLIYSARTLHYLNYENFEALLKKLESRLKKNGKIFITVTGVESEIGKKYPCAEKKIEERFCFLEKEYQERFEIKEKIFLMNFEEFQEIFKKYFILEEAWESDFKNLFFVGFKK